MTFPWLAAAMGGQALVSGLVGGLNYHSQQQANQSNLQSVRETNRQNERLMRESWSREDKAVQRRVADLKAAGLSPTLAAGSAASTSGPIRLDSPRSEAPMYGQELVNIIPQMVQMAQAKEQIHATAAAAEASKVQAESGRADILSKLFDLDNKKITSPSLLKLLEQQIRNAQTEGALRFQDLKQKQFEVQQNEWKGKFQGKYGIPWDQLPDRVKNIALGYEFGSKAMNDLIDEHKRVNKIKENRKMEETRSQATHTGVRG